MKITKIEKLNQLISRTDMTGSQKVEWLTNFIEEHVTEQLRLHDVVKSLPKERPNTTSTLYPIKEKKCFWCGNKR